MKANLNMSCKKLFNSYYPYITIITSRKAKTDLILKKRFIYNYCLYIIVL